jgi:hypothetical protein
MEDAKKSLTQSQINKFKNLPRLQSANLRPQNKAMSYKSIVQAQFDKHVASRELIVPSNFNENIITQEQRPQSKRRVLSLATKDGHSQNTRSANQVRRNYQTRSQAKDQVEKA